MQLQRLTRGRARRCRCLRAPVACHAVILSSMHRRIRRCARSPTRRALPSPALRPAWIRSFPRPATFRKARRWCGRSKRPVWLRPSFRPLRNRRLRRDEVLPTSFDLAASGTALPELHLDIHVYSANPAERFVFVNMRKYAEGQALKEGPTRGAHHPGRRGPEPTRPAFPASPPIRFDLDINLSVDTVSMAA